jgi:hypothetical protein
LPGVDATYRWYAALFAAFVCFTPVSPAFSPVFAVWHAHCFVGTHEKIYFYIITLHRLDVPWRFVRYG